MKFKFLIFLVLATLFVNGQQAQKGLLWKISGNGLTKPSYIYGNMHVSSKIAFHLGEEFFDAVQSVDKIALESNPIIWLDEIMNSDLAYNYIGNYNIGSQVYKGFYREAFKLNIPTNSEYADALADNHYFMNWLLYRENQGRQDFEEETFLDMFIYQSGDKNGKPVISMEDFKETTKYFEYAQLPDEKKKEYSPWYTKLTEEKSYSEIMSEAYRNQDLSLIDSLQNEVSSDNSLKYMIYIRNEIMAQRIDSVLKSGTSLFSGVGAAHLPGDKGMLRLLEKMGYTLTPMPVTFTDKARKLREQFDDKKIPYSQYKDYSSDLFSLKTPVSIYETPYAAYQRMFFGPELTNGSHVTIKQISTYSFFKGIKPSAFKNKIDSLLFENIPGKIISKQAIKTKYFEGYDITNKTKTGDYQRYKIFITPFDILIFKMGGKDEFVKDNGNFFFDNIFLKEPTTSWKTVSPISNEWSVEVPDYYSMVYNTKVNNLYGNTALQAFDIADSSYFFVDKAYLHDFVFIENDEFELKRTAEKFFKNLKIDSFKTEIAKGTVYPTAFSFARTADSSYLKLKVVINGSNYYLLAQVAKTDSYSEKFFNSFKFNEFDYQFAYSEKQDSILYFKTKSQYLIPDDFRFIREKAYEIRNKNKKKEDKDYFASTKTYKYYSENSEAVEVKFFKFHDFISYTDLDSLWKRETNAVAMENGLIIGKMKTSKKNNDDIMEVSYSDTGSTRAIFAKYVLHGGVLYRLKTVTDTSLKLSRFVKEFYDNFMPYDTMIGRSPFEDKAILFFKYLYGSDSLLRERAFKSVDYVEFKPKDADSLKLTIDKYKFGEKNFNVKKELISQYGMLKTGTDINYLKQQYHFLEDTSMYQIAILGALSDREEKGMEKEYLKLLNYDVPIGGDMYSGYSLFSGFWDEPKKHLKIFPDLLDYTFVENYRSNIIGLLAMYLDSGYISPKVYSKHVDKLLREAKLVLKGQISSEQSSQTSGGNTYSYSYYRSSNNDFKYEGNEVLEDYIKVLMPYFNKKTEVKGFIAKVGKSMDFEVQNTLVCCKLRNNINVDTAIINKLAADVVNVSLLYEKMDDFKVLNNFPAKYLNQQHFAKSYLFNENFDFEKDSLEFIERRLVNTGKEEGYVYFFKTKSENDDNWELNYVGIFSKDEKMVAVEDPDTERGETIKKSKPLNEMIDEAIRIVELKPHKRADGSDDSYGGYYYDDYEY